MNVVPSEVMQVTSERRSAAPCPITLQGKEFGSLSSASRKLSGLATAEMGCGPFQPRFDRHVPVSGLPQMSKRMCSPSSAVAVVENSTSGPVTRALCRYRGFPYTTSGGPSSISDPFGDNTRMRDARLIA